jgi:hypothetical protein
MIYNEDVKIEDTYYCYDSEYRRLPWNRRERKGTHTENGGNIYLRNIGNTAHIHTMPRSKCSININFGGLTSRKKNRSQWPRGLRHELSSPARILGSWVRTPLKAWMSVCVYSVFVLFCIYVAALRRADPPSKENYPLCVGLRN